MYRLKRLIKYLAGFYLLAVVFFGWGIATYKFQIFPFWQIQPIYSNVISFFLQNHHENLVDTFGLDHQEVRTDFDFHGLRIVDKDFTDNGFLLISQYSKVHSQVIVTLFDIENNQPMHHWVPNIELILAVTPSFSTNTNTPMGYRAQHPLLMPGGDLLLGSGEGPLVRIDACGRLKWVINRHFHHSIELDVAGNIVAPIVSIEITDELTGLEVRKDGIAVVSPQGEILSEYSMHEVLLENGYHGLVYGVGMFENDRYHINDAQPLRGKTAGDGVLFSMRHLSSVGLFIPKTGAIEWLKTGPWLAQHDINDLGDGRYSIFGNNLVRFFKSEMRESDMVLGDHSEIYIFNPATGLIETPYSEVLKKIGMISGTEGRLRILDNADAFIEETNNNRLLRVSRNRVRWEYVSAFIDQSSGTQQTSGALHWSRYLSRDAVKTDWLEALSCE